MEVYIVGSTSTWKDTPFHREAEFWGMNTMWSTQSVEKFTRWFDLHDYTTMYENYPGHENQDHLDWLNTDNGIDVWVWESELDRTARGVPFPTDKVLAHFHPWRYFTNSATWMVGLAIIEGATKIGVYGIDMATSKEHRRERPSVEWLLGYALGQGIEVEVPPTSDLLHVGYLYGAEQASDVTEKIRAYIADLEDREETYLQLERKYRRRADQMRGAIDSLEYVNYSWLEKPDADYRR